MPLEQSAKEKLAQVKEILDEVSQDSTVPRNVRLNLDEVKEIFNFEEEIGEEELSMQIDKALVKLEEINEDMNLEAYTRTQVYNIVSILESI